MRLLLLILLLPFISEAQIINASQPYRVKAAAGGGCSYLLDQYTGATAAYSLRKLDCDYSGSAIRVRRSSDNTESDIGFVNGDLDTATLKTFVGTGGSDDGFIVTWYDQAASNNMAQATSGSQPMIMDNGVVLRDGGLPTVYFAGTNDFLSVANFMGSASAATLFAIISISADPPTCNDCGAFIQTIATSGQLAHQPFSDGVIYDGWGSNSRKTTGNPSNSLATQYLYCVISIFSDWRSYIDNTLFYSTVTNTVQFLSAIVLGKSDDGAGNVFYYQGKISEVIIYDSGLSDSNRNGVAGNINTYYTIY